MQNRNSVVAEAVDARGGSVVAEAVVVDARASGRVSGSGLRVVKASDLTLPAGALTSVMPPQPGECEGLSTTHYLKKILTSKVYDIAVRFADEFEPSRVLAMGGTAWPLNEGKRPHGVSSSPI